MTWYQGLVKVRAISAPRRVRLSLPIGSPAFDPPSRDILLKEIDGEILSIDVGIAWDLGAHLRLPLGFGGDAIANAGPDFTFMAAWRFARYS